jgi:hypothetical protein
MMRGSTMGFPRTISTVATLAAFALICASCADPAPGAGWDGALERPFAEIVVDVAGRQGERIPVSVTLVGFDFGDFTLSNEVDPEYRFHDVRLFDAAGAEVGFTERGKRYKVGPFAGDVLRIEYGAQPGGEGRHGRQGLVGDDFTIFDGRLYPSFTGDRKLRAARIRFTAPDGWTVASPFRKSGRWYYLDTLGPEVTSSILAKACVGVGRYDVRTRTIGETEVRVASYAGWSEEHKAALADKTYRMVAWFREVLDFDLRAPYAVVWTPKSGSDRVFGGSYSTGTCMEHPKDTPSNWRLLGHRLAHSMNKYKPSGMAYAGRADRWFEEAFASYAEMVATEATGIVEDQRYWNDLYLSYLKGRLSSPEMDLPLVDEPDARDDTKEFVHYRKAPLVLRMLAEETRARSGKTMEQFVRAMWAKHGSFRGLLSFQPELEAFTGASFDDFWALAVEQRGVVVPVWPECLTPEVRKDRDAPPAARVGGAPVSGDYLHHLASSGEFDTFAAIREHLIAEQAARDRLAALGARLLPEEIAAHLHALPPAARREVARYEAAYLDRLAPRGAAAEPPAFAAEADHPDGRAFATLLSLEHRYAQQVREGSLEAILVRKGDRAPEAAPPYRLGFAVNADLALETSWRMPPRGLTVQIAAGDEERDVEVPDPRGRTRIAFDVVESDRENEPGIVTVRVTAAGGTSVTRAFWQRGEEARLPERLRNLSREELMKLGRERAARRRGAREQAGE